MTFHVIITTAHTRPDGGTTNSTHTSQWVLDSEATEESLYQHVFEKTVERLGTDKFSILFYRAVPNEIEGA